MQLPPRDSYSHLVSCPEHGSRPAAHLCRHLLDGSGAGFVTAGADAPWPDAWCEECDRLGGPELVRTCSRCYEAVRRRQTPQPEAADRPHAALRIAVFAIKAALVAVGVVLALLLLVVLGSYAFNLA